MYVLLYRIIPVTVERANLDNFCGNGY